MSRPAHSADMPINISQAAIDHRYTPFEQSWMKKDRLAYTKASEQTLCPPCCPSAHLVPTR